MAGYSGLPRSPLSIPDIKSIDELAPSIIRHIATSLRANYTKHIHHGLANYQLSDRYKTWVAIRHDMIRFSINPDRHSQVTDTIELCVNRPVSIADLSCYYKWGTLVVSITDDPILIMVTEAMVARLGTNFLACKESARVIAVRGKFIETWKAHRNDSRRIVASRQGDELVVYGKSYPISDPAFDPAHFGVLADV